MIRKTFKSLIAASVLSGALVALPMPASADEQQPAKETTSVAPATVTVNDANPNDGVVVEEATPREETAVDTAAAQGNAEDCKSEVTDLPDGVSVDACVYSETAANAKVKAHVRAKVNGKTQLSHVDPDAQAWTVSKALKCQSIFISKSMYNGSKRKVQKRIKRIALNHLVAVAGSKCLRLEHGSWWFNAGKEGDRKVPVLQQVHGDWSLMVQDSRTGVLEHYGEKRPTGFWLVCGNDWIWVAVDYYNENEVTWVKSEADVVEDAEMEGHAAGAINLSGTKACPGGNVNWEIYLSTDTYASVMAKLTLGVIAKQSGDGWAEAIAKAIATARANGYGRAIASLDITCGDAPPPPHEEVTGSVICKNPPHLYAPHGNGTMVCELTRSDDVKPTLSQFSVEALNDFASFAQPTEFDFREEAEINACPANVLCVRVQVWAVSPGLFKYRFRYGQQAWVNGQFEIKKDDFKK